MTIQIPDDLARVLATGTCPVSDVNGQVDHFRLDDNPGIERHSYNHGVQLRTTLIGIGTGSRASVRYRHPTRAVNTNAS
jgi:hypothetical protein